MENFLETKVLFLDIDGVLNTNEHRRSLPAIVILKATDDSFVAMIDSEKVRIINEIFDAVEDLRLVLSTAWRYAVPGGPPQVLRCLEQAGFKHTDRYEGRTVKYMSSTRAEEIHLWMREHPEVTHAVVLDDLPCVLSLKSKTEPYLIIHTDDEIGLLPEHREEILAFLRG